MSAICLEYAAASSSISSADFMVQKTFNLSKNNGLVNDCNNKYNLSNEIAAIKTQHKFQVFGLGLAEEQEMMKPYKYNDTLCHVVINHI